MSGFSQSFIIGDNTFLNIEKEAKYTKSESDSFRNLRSRTKRESQVSFY